MFYATVATMELHPGNRVGRGDLNLREAAARADLMLEEFDRRFPCRS